MREERFITYFRVSTDRQGRSGLGLEAQQQAVRQFLSGRAATVIAEFIEVESGSKNDRPKLKEALEACQRSRATLLIAKLDRLARSVAFISALMEAKTNFLAVDMPHASRLVLHVMAAFAEHEREMIRERTKAALAAAKARGVRLGANGAALAERHKADATAHAVTRSVYRWDAVLYLEFGQNINNVVITIPCKQRGSEGMGDTEVYALHSFVQARVSSGPMVSWTTWPR